MSSEESQNSANSAENSTKSDSGSYGETSSSGSMRYVASHSFAYDDEPLAEPEQRSDGAKERRQSRPQPMVSIFIVLHTYLYCEIFITNVSRLDKNILLCNTRQQLLCFLVNLTSDNYMVLLFKSMQYFCTVFFI